MHLVAGKPLLSHVLDAVRGAGSRPVVVLSKESEPARAIVGDGAVVAMQDPPQGTGDAVRVALGAIPDGSGDAFIVYGDTPLLRASTLRALAELRAKRGAQLALLSGMVGTSNAYGRVVRDASGDVARSSRCVSRRRKRSASRIEPRRVRSRSRVAAQSGAASARERDRRDLPHRPRRARGRGRHARRGLLHRGSRRGHGREHACRARGRGGCRAAPDPRAAHARRRDLPRSRLVARRCGC
jgi:CTP:molybdopterin cytidylyltransferase MocA